MESINKMNIERSNPQPINKKQILMLTYALTLLSTRIEKMVMMRMKMHFFFQSPQSSAIFVYLTILAHSSIFSYFDNILVS